MDMTIAEQILAKHTVVGFLAGALLLGGCVSTGEQSVLQPGTSPQPGESPAMTAAPSNPLDFMSNEAWQPCHHDRMSTFAAIFDAMHNGRA